MFKTNSWQKIGMLVVLCACWQADGQTAKTLYPRMAPLEQYVMERNAEITLARSAAPDSISRDADVFVMGVHGYEIAAKGKSGFVCLVMRSWMAGPEDPDFWNPKLRGPACFNAAAVRSYLPIVFKRSELVLAAMPKDQVFEMTKSSFEKKELPPIEPGSMCYMMSPYGYLSDADGRWHPHLMFFVPQISDMAWGAGLPGSPVLVGQDPADHLTVFLIPVAKWSDGTAEHSDDNGDTHKH